MSLKPQVSSYTKVPAGTYVARLVQVIDLGTQPSKKYDPSSQVLLGWEIPDIKEDDGRPVIHFQRYANYFSAKSNLRKLVVGWRGRDFTSDEIKTWSAASMLGKECLLNLAETEKGDKVYVDVASASRLPNGMACPPQVSKTILFDLDNPDMEVFGAFSEKLQDTIKASPEWEAATSGGSRSQPPASASFDDDDDAPPF